LAVVGSQRFPREAGRVRDDWLDWSVVGRSTFVVCSGISHTTRKPMLGTDSPWQVMGGHTYKDSLDLTRVPIDFLTDNDRDWPLQKTAQRMFFS